MRSAWAWLFVVGCAGLPVSAVVKPPLECQCNRLPIKGCGNLVDGALQYAQGDKAAAMHNLDLARKQNSPAELGKFADSLRSAAAMPGAESVAQPLREVADLLSAPAQAPDAPAEANTEAVVAAARAPIPQKVSTAAFARSGGNATKERNPNSLAATGEDLDDVSNPYNRRSDVRLAPNASSDPSRIFTASQNLSAQEGRTACKIMGLDATCFTGREGPLIVSDVIGAPGCSDRLFLAATESDTTLFGFHWLFEVPYGPIVGARLIVRSGEWLQFAIVPGKKGPSGSSECQLTWSAFRP